MPIVVLEIIVIVGAFFSPINDVVIDTLPKVFWLINLDWHVTQSALDPTAGKVFHCGRV